SLSAHPDYIALSYTWGNANDTSPALCDGKKIKITAFCDGKKINITKNLREALWQLRESRNSLARKFLSKNRLAQPLYFWIDAVCINQSDKEEKSCQVGLMADIYRQAYNVIVWLGPSDDSSDSIVDYLNGFGAKAEDCHMETGHEPYRKVWRDMASMTPAKQGLRQSHIFIRDVDGSVTTVSMSSLQKLFRSISGWHDQDDLLPIAGMMRFFTRPW
ncbi:heterokaryon incompatibility protein-domain-containing protein, partial [Phaeosphaeriaceae sp. PMI808]